MKILSIFLAAGALAFPPLAGSAGEWGGTQNAGQTDLTSAAVREQLVESVAAVVRENYVFPETGAKIAAALFERLKSGAYDDAVTADRMTRALTEDMRSISKDIHIGVIENRRIPPGTVSSGGPGSATSPAGKTIPFRNYGFQQAVRMPGNIGCIVIDEWAGIEGKTAAWKTAQAALLFVAHAQALIIDLRDNIGGREEMAVRVLSYLFEEPTHLLTKLDRGQKEKRETWTTPPGEAGNWARVPLFVLTSRHTVSGGEMFAYVLKSLKRALIVGEKTRGAAHYTHLFPLQDLPFTVAVPVGTAVDPVTGANWEGAGVEPDIIVEAGIALDTAYRRALAAVLESDAPALLKQEVRWALPEVEARLDPASPKIENIQEYAGMYGTHRISGQDGSLYCSLNEKESKRMLPMTKDLFAFEDKGMFYIRLQFVRDETGSVSGLRLLYDTGQKQDIPRTNR